MHAEDYVFVLQRKHDFDVIRNAHGTVGAATRLNSGQHAAALLAGNSNAVRRSGEDVLRDFAQRWRTNRSADSANLSEAEGDAALSHEHANGGAAAESQRTQSDVHPFRMSVMLESEGEEEAAPAEDASGSEGKNMSSSLV